MGKLNDIFALCGYAWYGFGGHQSIGKQPLSVSGYDLVNADGKWVSTIRAAPKFGWHRMFVDNWIVVPETQPPFTLKTNPTEQNFYFDDFFKLQKANGIKNIWSASGCFDHYKPALGSYSQRKTACYNPAMQPSNPAAWEDLASLCNLVTTRYLDSHLVDYIQILNEWDFRWNVPHVLTPEEYAVGFWECYKAIRSVSQTQGIMSGCTLNADLTTAKRFIGAVFTLAANEGKPKPTDWTFTVNNYFRIGDNNQGNGIGATPEEVDRYGVYYKPLNDYLEEIGLDGFAVTETGYNSSPSTSATAMKNKAPQLEGFTLEEAQGILAIRTALIIGSLPKCKAICFYHCKDGYEAEPFTYHGFNYDKDFGGKEDWSAKPARTICEEFLEKYGEMTVRDFTTVKINGKDVYAVSLAGAQPFILAWTDKNVNQGYTPMPTPIEDIPQPQPMLTIQNKVLYKDGQPFRIKELNSPETLLNKSLDEFKAIIDYAVSCGLNTIYCTLYAGDKYASTLHPYNGTKEVTIPNGTKKQMGNPSSGFNMPKINDWKVKLEYAASKGMVLHLLLSEKENHHVHTTEEGHAQIDMMVEQFDHLPVIWDREEVPLGRDGWIIDQYTYLKAKTRNITAIHNNTGEKPWVGHSDIIDLLSIQADVSQFDSIIKAETANEFAVYTSEATGTHAAGDTAKAARLRDAGGNLSSGAGIYIAPLDQDATLDQLKSYESVFKTLSGTTTPNPSTMTIGYSTKSDRSDFKPLTSPLPVGSIYLEARGATAPVVFSLKTKSGTVLMNKTENTAPFDVHGGAAWNAPAGEYVLTVSDKVTAAKEYAFTVGTITTPPQEIEGKRFFKRDGKAVFEYMDGSEIILG